MRMHNLYYSLLNTSGNSKDNLRHTDTRSLAALVSPAFSCKAVISKALVFVLLCPIYNQNMKTHDPRYSSKVHRKVSLLFTLH